MASLIMLVVYVVSAVCIARVWYCAGRDEGQRIGWEARTIFLKEEEEYHRDKAAEEDALLAEAAGYPQYVWDGLDLDQGEQYPVVAVAG